MKSDNIRLGVISLLLFKSKFKFQIYYNLLELLSFLTLITAP